MLAKSAKELLPSLTNEESISITKLTSLYSLTEKIVHTRPFRHPHHTASITSIIGGGSSAKPGEISLAHHGVLFLDELPEFPRSVLESLRQPLEDHEITITRTNYRYDYPANFILIATMNPCPCGHLNDPDHPCTCLPHQISNYHKKISGPLLDRIDLTLKVNPIKTQKIFSPTCSKLKNFSTLNVVKNKITGAILHQKHRYHQKSIFNGTLPAEQIFKFINLDSKSKSFLDKSAHVLKLSTRSYFKIIKIARTIADLENSTEITTHHIAEALSYRSNPLESD